LGLSEYVDPPVHDRSVTSTVEGEAALELEASSSAAFDATDFDRIDRFFDDLPTSVDHVMVTARGPFVVRAAKHIRLPRFLKFWADVLARCRFLLRTFVDAPGNDQL